MATLDFRGWRIESYDTGWALGKPKTRLNKRKQLEIYLHQPTYYPRLAAALQGLLERELKASDASTAREILELIRQVQAELRELIPA